MRVKLSSQNIFLPKNISCIELTGNYEVFPFKFLNIVKDMKGKFDKAYL